MGEGEPCEECNAGAGRVLQTVVEKDISWGEAVPRSYQGRLRVAVSSVRDFVGACLAFRLHPLPTLCIQVVSSHSCVTFSLSIRLLRCFFALGLVNRKPARNPFLKSQRIVLDEMSVW